MALEQERTSQRGGTKENNPGNFANDREKASRAGHKGGKVSGGNFANDPGLIADLFRQALDGPFKGAFRRVTFAIVDTTPGRINVTGSTISDTHNYGLLTVEGVIQKSSNVGTTKIAMQMPAKEMWETFSAAGFGQKPQIGFPGAISGRLRPYKTWRPVEQATMSYGYGLSASLFQMARSYTVFANGGRVIPATMLKTAEPAVGVPVFSERTADQVRKMLQMAAGPGGTGQKAQTVGYSVGGKSGTARKQVGKNYAIGKYRAWFTGMAPIDKPRIVVAVMIDEPSNGVYYGGAVAAPVFSEVVQQTLRMMGVQPDMAVKPQIVAKAVEESF